MRKLILAVPICTLLLLGLTVDVGLARRLAQAPPVSSESPVSMRRAPSRNLEERLSYDDQNQALGRFCVRCHNDASLSGGLTLESFDVARAAERAEIAEKMIRKLRAGMMPPQTARQPDRAVVEALVAALENTIDESAAADPEPGRRTFQRLNRAEYAASVRHLLGIDINVSAFLPLDTKSASFDNIADVQMPSATLMEGYLRAAGHISRAALGDAEADSASTVYTVPRTASQKERVEGAPYGTRGGISVVHNFPADGKYEFRVMPHVAPEGELFGRTSLGEAIDISIDGARVAFVELDRWMSESDAGGATIVTEPIDIRAGPRQVAVAFIRRDDGPEDDLITPIDHTLADQQIGLGYGVTTLPHLSNFSIVGPFEVTGVSDTPTRRRIFTCRPTAPDEAAPCAESILARLATQAYRRPLRADDLAGLMRFYEQGATQGGFEGGIRMAVQALLASPHFVFRMEAAPHGLSSGEVYRISDVALASRLSFFLWGVPPDQELVDLAARRELSKPPVLESQVRRMVAEARSEALATRFAAQWLRLQDLQKVHPDALNYPYFDHTLAEAMQRETEMLFSFLVREDRSVLELLTADYTFVNERLARHYGMPGVSGSEFRRVTYTDERRRGVLGHGSILTLTSHANRTSPVLRGKWIMEVLLGSPPPPPPPDIPDLEETDSVRGDRLLSVREQLAEHRANPACSSCHNVIDPIGLALDNFDVTGAWRIRDRGVPVDASGQLYDGTPIHGPSDLREALLSRSDVFVTFFTESLMAYALGRRVEYYDMPAIRQIVREAEKGGYPMSSLVLGVAKSTAFLMSRTQTATADGIE